MGWIFYHGGNVTAGGAKYLWSGRPAERAGGAFAYQLLGCAGSNTHLCDTVMNLDLLAQVETAVAA